MAAVLTEVVGTRTSLTVTNLSTLASATYCVSNTITCSGLNQAVELEAATTNTPAGQKQIKIFVQESLDGTNFRTGPTSGTTTTREPNLRQVEALPITTASTTERLTFDLKSALGYIPHSAKIVFLNDLGVALTSAVVYVSTLTPTLT